MNLLTAATVVHINAELLALASGVVIPLLTALLTKLNASSTLKAVLNAALAAAAGAIATATQAGGTVASWQTWVLNMALAFVGTVAADFGVLQQTPVKAAFERAMPGFGLGPRRATTAISDSKAP